MRWVDRHWQEDTLLSRMLLPLSGLYLSLHHLNRTLYRYNWRRAKKFSVPVIVIGNITVGGTGKTPLVLWTAKYLKQRGWRPGIVTRGYGGRAHNWPQLVMPGSDPALVGDEPVLLARRTQVPVVADPVRTRAVEHLIAQGCNVIVSDDGLQHYALRRDIEIAVIDGERRFGNGRSLPAGPLRELPARLDEVDACVVNGRERRGEWSMRFQPTGFYRVAAPHDNVQLESFRGRTVHAIAGIGHPPRFFGALRELGLQVIEHSFPDHHDFTQEEVRFADSYDVIMTEKDAVKCESFANASMWYLAIEARLDPAFGNWLEERLGKRTDG